MAGPGRPPKKKTEERIRSKYATPEVGEYMVFGLSIMGTLDDNGLGRELAVSVAPVSDVLDHGNMAKITLDIDAAKIFKMKVGVDFQISASDIAERLENLAKAIRKGVK